MKHRLPIITPARRPSLDEPGITLSALLALRAVQVIACCTLGAGFVAAAVLLRYLTR